MTSRRAGLWKTLGWASIAVLAPAIGAGGCGSSKPSAGQPDGGGGGLDAGGAEGGVPQKLVILHTNDIHSHLMGASPELDYTPATLNDDATVGGIARLVSAISAAKRKAATDGKEVLLLDAGDFMMGTLFEFLGASSAVELQFMQALGYDATTIGNHELDWTPHGLAGILQAAVTHGVTLPILASNMNFSATDPGDDDLKAFADPTTGVIKTKLVKTVGTLKIGFFGLLGSDAVQVTPQAKPLTFDPIATAAARMVTELRDIDKVDLVIALSHSGIDHAGKGEDADLAAQVDGIDIIVSGHTHETLTSPVTVQGPSGGKTLIVTAGAYEQYLGKLEVTVKRSATAGGAPVVTVDNYTLMPMDDTIMGDAPTQAMVDAYVAGIDTALGPAGLAYKKVVAETAANLPLPAYQEAPIGNLVTDAYRTIVGALQPTEPPVIAVEGNGQLRSDIAKGKTGQIWFADLFRVSPIGIGPDQKPGYPLVTFYLSAKDIRSGLELGAAPELVNNEFFLQVSGLKVTYDMTKPPFGRVSSLKLVTPTGDEDIGVTNTTTCHKVVTTSYVAGLLGVVSTFTKGALSVIAKDQTCTTPVDPTIRYVDADPNTAGVQEIKHWQAFVKYVSGLPDTNGNSIPDVPAAYLTTQGRIVKN